MGFTLNISPKFLGPVAHLVERRIRIAKVVGSSPIGSTEKFLMKFFSVNT